MLAIVLLIRELLVVRGLGCLDSNCIKNHFKITYSVANNDTRVTSDTPL